MIAALCLIPWQKLQLPDATQEELFAFLKSIFLEHKSLSATQLFSHFEGRIAAKGFESSGTQQIFEQSPRNFSIKRRFSRLPVCRKNCSSFIKDAIQWNISTPVLHLLSPKAYTVTAINLCPTHKEQSCCFDNSITLNAHNKIDFNSNYFSFN